MGDAMKRALLIVVLAAACTGAAKEKDAPPAKTAAATVAPKREVAPRDTPRASRDSERQKFPVVVKSDAAATCEAHFEGEAPPPDLKAPLVFGTTRLFFTFKDSKTALEFNPQGELFFSDWSFDIFSPDGKWVALLQDRFGPYHVVSVAKLPDYLKGKAQPDKVVTVPRNPGEQALVHSGAKWVSASELEYQVGGETSETMRASVP